MSGQRIVVAMCGCMRSGKDTAARHLRDSHAFVNLKVAAPLKQGIVHMFGFSEEQVEGDAKDQVDSRWNVTPRQVMQWLGTDVFQHRIDTELLPGIGRSFWTTQLLMRIHDLDGHVVISDVRFQHELDALERLDAAVFRVVTVKLERCMGAAARSDAPHDLHESERCMLRTHHVVHNDSTVAALTAQLDALIRCRAAAATHAAVPYDPAVELVPRPGAPAQGPVCA